MTCLKICIIFFRVHCQNIFDLYYAALQNKSKLEQNSNSSVDYQQMVNRTQKMKEILMGSGCNSQVCKTLQVKLSPERNIPSYPDDVLVMRLSAAE